MTTELLAALVAFAFVSSITPGPNNLMLMASGTNYGFGPTIPHMLGVALGFVVMIVLVGAGLIRIFDLVPAIYVVIKYASALYLLWLAWRMATTVKPIGAAATGARPMTFIEAALFQWVNPKAWTMALTAVSAYIPADDPTTGLVTVAIVFGIVNLPSVGTWALMGVQMRRFLADPRRLRAFNIVAALTLVATLYPVLMPH